MNWELKRLKKIWELDSLIEKLYREIPRLEEIDKLLAQIAIDEAYLNIPSAGKERCKLGLKATELTNLRNALLHEKTSLLESHNLNFKSLEAIWDCPLCEDRGYTDFGCECKCLVQAENERIFQLSGLTTSMQAQTFDKFELSWYESPEQMLQIKQRCLNFADNLINKIPQRNLVLFGDVGLGKTFLACSIANYVLNNGVTVIYKTFSQLLQLIRQIRFNWDSNNYNYKDLERLRDVDFLILDDLGAENISNFVIEELFNLLNDRLNLGKASIISTNLAIHTGELEKIYGRRISDRILNNSWNFHFIGQSIREQKKDAERIS